MKLIQPRYNICSHESQSCSWLLEAGAGEEQQNKALEEILNEDVLGKATKVKEGVICSANINSL